jgi:lysophospholipase L1-like esterase
VKKSDLAITNPGDTRKGMLKDNMKQVVLVGDSIRMGYEPRVRKHLSDVAVVWGPKQNGGNSVNLLGLLHLWTEHRQPDLIHFNCGLHDLRTIFQGSKETVVPLDHYRRNLHTLIRIMRERTQATLVWASTTPIIDEDAHREHAKWLDFDRSNEQVLRYNEVAREVMEIEKVPVNDLYAVVCTHGPASLQNGDGVHYSEAGSRILGDAVADFLLEHL